MHLVSFELVALALIVVTLGVHQHLREHAPATSQVAVVVGLVRAGLLLASVMVFDHGMAVVVDQHASDPQQAAATWQVIEPVAEALGGTGGDVLGGVWLLLVSWVALRAKEFPRALNWLGLDRRRRRAALGGARAGRSWKSSPACCRSCGSSGSESSRCGSDRPSCHRASDRRRVAGVAKPLAS